jgi:hyperosmotically inducible protein
MHDALKLAAFTAAALLLGGCNAMKGTETTGQYVDDATLTARAKSALISDKNVSATDFHLEVYQGNVTISGVAKTAEESKRAEEDIRKVPGVKSVNNAVRVASTNSTASDTSETQPQPKSR